MVGIAGTMTAFLIYFNAIFLFPFSVDVNFAVGSALSLAVIVLSSLARRNKTFPLLGRRPALWDVAIPVVVFGGLVAFQQLPESAADIERVWTAGPAFLLAKRNGIDLFLFAVNLVAVAPLVEELLFRGLFFQTLTSAGFGRIAVVIITASLFALGHYPYGLSGMVNPLIMGCACGALRAWRGSISGPLLLHSAWNLALVIYAIRLLYLR